MTEISRLEGVGRTTRRDRKSLPVLYQPGGTGDAGRRAKPERESGWRPHLRGDARTGRSGAPFLAQLSLQYDGIEVARTARRERLQSAVHAYGARPEARSSEADFDVKA